MPDVSIERHENKVWLRSRFEDKDLAKSVVGGRWDATNKVWAYPLDIEICRRLRETFGPRLKVGTELAAWASTALLSEKEATRLLSMDLTADIELKLVPEVAPKMWAAMQKRGYQPVAAAYAVEVGNCINADQPGLGKTIETFASIIEAGVEGLILVIAPRTALVATWRPEIEKWFSDVKGDVAIYVATGAKAEREEIIQDALFDPARFTFLIVNPEMVRTRKAKDCSTTEFECSKNHVHMHHDYPKLFTLPFDFIVGDEVHRYLMRGNPKSRNVTQVGLGFQKLKSKDGGLRRIALTGTPMRGKPKNLWSTLRWLRPDLYPSQHRWNKMYFETEENRYAYTGETVTDKLRPDREAAFNRELSRIMLRRTKSELRQINPAWAPPDKTYIEVWLPMEAQQAKQYRAMEKNASVTLEGGSLSATGILAEMTRLKQFAGCSGKLVAGHFTPAMPSNKVDWLLDDFLPSRGITGDPETEQGDAKVVIASQFTQLINVLRVELDKAGIASYIITGETKDRDRAMYQAIFQASGGARVFLINTNAGGVSITLDAADDCVLLDETWVPDDQEQVEDRIHRTSNVEHAVNIYYVRSSGTIEEEIAATVELKDESQKRVLDGRRGIEYAKRKYAVSLSG